MKTKKKQNGIESVRNRGSLVYAVRFKSTKMDDASKPIVDANNLVLELGADFTSTAYPGKSQPMSE